MDYLAAIRRDSDRFYDAAEQADFGLPVASCPDWTVGDLVWHLGEVQWFWGTIVEQRAPDPGPVEEAKPARPDDAGLVAWGRAQADRLLAVLKATADDVPVWTWALNEADHSVGFVRRHQVQEAAVHRWDVQQAVAPPAEAVEPEVAADSIDELLAITLPWGVRPDKPMTGSVHLHCADTTGEWLVHPDGRVEQAHAKGDAALRGSASDLLLAIYKRIPMDRVEVIGDAAVAEEFLARVQTS